MLLVVYPLRWRWLHFSKKKNELSKLKPLVPMNRYATLFKIAVDGQDANNDWQDITYQILVDVLFAHVTVQGPISCLMDQVLCYRSLCRGPDGELAFQQANNITRCCAALQHGLYSVAITHVRLKSISVPKYNPLYSKQSPTLMVYY